MESNSFFKQGKATLQINKAKKPLSYSIKTAKELLLGQREGNKKEDEETNSEPEDTSKDESNANENNETDPSDENSNADAKNGSSKVPDPLEIFSQFDFVPRDKLLFFDDFSQDFVGGFPSRCNTNAILLASGLANIKPQSLGIVRQISQVLMEVKNLKLNIIGHNDSDGPDATNLKLTKARAAAVKEALIAICKIPGYRLTTDGKGETEPVDDISTADGKAQNRRVEFVKI